MHRFTVLHLTLNSFLSIYIILVSFLLLSSLSSSLGEYGPLWLCRGLFHHLKKHPDDVTVMSLNSIRPKLFSKQRKVTQWGLWDWKMRTLATTKCTIILHHGSSRISAAWPQCQDKSQSFSGSAAPILMTALFSHTYGWSSPFPPFFFTLSS